jgi:hypothetical protein
MTCDIEERPPTPHGPRDGTRKEHFHSIPFHQQEEGTTTSLLPVRSFGTQLPAPACVCARLACEASTGVQSVGPPPAKFVTTLGCAVSFVESVSGPLRQLAGHTRASAGEATHVQLACDQLAAAAPAPHHQTPCRNRGAWAGRRRRRLCLCWWWSLTCHEALRRNENRATEPVRRATTK